MPSVIIQNPNPGLLVDVWVGLSAPDQRSRHNRGENIPPNIPVTALIDTGSASTIVDLALLAHLGIQGHNPIQIQGVGGVIAAHQYAASLQLPGIITHNPLENVRVSGFPLSLTIQQRSIPVLIGRNILSRCHLDYDGILNTCRLD